MVNGYSEQTAITTNFKSRYQKRGGSHFFAYYGKKFSQRLFKFETREMGIFSAFFFAQPKIFLTEGKTTSRSVFGRELIFQKRK
jgi:hypothetical protein